jgi:hypothetical protein
MFILAVEKKTGHWNCHIVAEVKNMKELVPKTASIFAVK